MTNFLVRHFIKDCEKTDNPVVREHYGILAGVVGICLNLALFTGKLTAGLVTGAISVTADAFNNLSDAASSVVTLVGFRIAGQKADADHPFGHGRMEYLAGLIVSLLILLVGVELGKTSIQKIFSPEDVDFSWLSAGILTVCVAVKLWMGRFYRILGQRIGSAAMEATAKDSLSDSAATTAVLAGLLLGHFTPLRIDGWAGLLVAAFILRAGYQAAKDTLDPLLGQPPEHSLVEEIQATLLAHPQIVGLHDMVIHDYGPGRRMMSVHAEVPADSDILEIHDVIDTAERELGAKFGMEAVIHMDPVIQNDPAVMQLREKVSELVREVHPSITIHDFRVTPGPQLTNLIFDAVVPYQVPLEDYEARQAISKQVRTLGEKYTAVVHIDRDYVR